MVLRLGSLMKGQRNVVLQHIVVLPLSHLVFQRNEGLIGRLGNSPLRLIHLTLLLQLALPQVSRLKETLLALLFLHETLIRLLNIVMIIGRGVVPIFIDVSGERRVLLFGHVHRSLGFLLAIEVVLDLLERWKGSLDVQKGRPD